MRSRISLGHDPADTCPQRTICKINSNCEFLVGPVGELITEVLHRITKEILSQISLQKKSHCKVHYKGNPIVNINTREILSQIPLQRKYHCKYHYKRNPIANLIAKEISL